MNVGGGKFIIRLNDKVKISLRRKGDGWIRRESPAAWLLNDKVSQSLLWKFTGNSRFFLLLQTTKWKMNLTSLDEFYSRLNRNEIFHDFLNSFSLRLLFIKVINLNWTFNWLFFLYWSWKFLGEWSFLFTWVLFERSSLKRSWPINENQLYDLFVWFCVWVAS